MLFCMLLLTACQGGELNDTETASQTTIEETTAPIENVPEPEFQLPEHDFEGQTFSTVTSPDSSHFIYSAELTGEIVNDAVYNTEITAEQLYNVDIVTNVIDGKDGNSIIIDTENDFLSGDFSYNMIYGNSVNMANAQIKGIYKNLNDVEGFHFDQPWWPKLTLDAFITDGQFYVGESTYTYSNLDRTHIIAVNKDLAADHGITIPYEDVKNGTWTLDKMIALTKDVYVDTNGDGAPDIGDTYGLLATVWANHWALSSNLSVLEKTGDDAILRINIDEEKMDALVQKIYGWFYEESGTWADYNPTVPFAAGTGIFAELAMVNLVSTLRDSEVRYGILPYPKYDEVQVDYHCYSQSFNFALPNVEGTCAFEGAVIEALSYYRYYDVIPAYKETVIKGKVADSVDDLEMADVIFNSMQSTFDRMYDNYHGMQIVLNVLIPEKNNNFASWYAAIKPAAETKLKELADFYRENR